LNDIYFGEYIDLVEEIENNLDFKEENKFLNNEDDKKVDSKNIISSEFYKFLVNSSKKRNKQYNKSMIFYNSLSLIMLSMLTGGLIGVVLIVYYSMKPEERENNFNIPL
jgi:quinol-cytochrome oxidoreductase complex cytochrome b subunit